MRQLTPEEQESSALAHAQTVQLLGEVLDYLKRLPPVPVTRELIDRIERESQEPAQAFARRRAMEARAAAGAMWGSDVWPKNGEPPLYVNLDLDDVVTLTYRDIDRRPAAAKRLLTDLARGIKIKLERTRW